MLRILPIIIFACTLLMVSNSARAQVRISGRVYDMSQSTPLASVSVLSTSGAGTVTDSVGRYSIVVKETDSIWFSYLDKATPKYSVANIRNFLNFEVALHVNVTELKQVMVKPPNYKLDSMQNREDYAKIFGFHKPGVSTSITPTGVGLDVGEFVNMFRFKRNKSMAAFRDRLLQEEQDKYIDHRFSRALVIRLTKLKGPALDTFMVQYRPTLDLVKNATEYEFQLYIKTSYEKFHKMQLIMGELKKEGE